MDIAHSLSVVKRNQQLTRLMPMGLLFLTSLLTSPASGFTQSANGTYTIIQDLVSSGGGQVGSGNPMSAVTILGLPAGGLMTNDTFTLVGGLAQPGPRQLKPVTMSISITGTVDDPLATVEVNGIPAQVDATMRTFSAENVPLSFGPNPITAIATDPLGNSASTSITVYLDLPEGKKVPEFTVPVRGTINEPTATVTVNGIPAIVSAGEFLAAEVPLVTGVNTLTAVAVDVAGNPTTRSIQVFVMPAARAPATPTVGTVGDPIPRVTTQSSITFGGTKVPGTAIWINGREASPLDDATTWTVTRTLIEGDNVFLIVTKDAQGIFSAPVIITIILDNEPPKVTFEPPAKTNFDPVSLRGSVDDSDTTVTINGFPDTMPGRPFEIAVDLSYGPNALHLIAVSPNAHKTEQDYLVTLGTIPTITAIQPADATKLYAGATVTITASATDKENDPLEFQLWLDGNVRVDWSAGASHPWTPSEAQIGLHTLEVRVRDGFGGYASRQAEVFVLRQPVSPP